MSNRATPLPLYRNPVTRQFLHVLRIFSFQDDRDETSKFEISVCDDFSGRWAFRSLSRGYFLGASPDALVCQAKAPADAELWFVHLAARPQVRDGDD